MQLSAMLKKLLAVCLLTLSCTYVLADDPLLDADHPDRYVVQKGDTLWDIADRFLKSPWLWPEIWQVNPQIANPHRIYPGDVISLEYIGGKPRLVLNRGKGREVKLSPRARTEPVDNAIPTIPLNYVEQFLTRPRIVDEETARNMPYIVDVQESRLMGQLGRSLYVMGLEDVRPGEMLVVLRPGHVYREVTDDCWGYDEGDPRTPKADPYRIKRHKTLEGGIAALWTDILECHNMHTRWLGHELMEIARVQVKQAGNPGVVVLLQVDQEVRKGDLLARPEESPWPLVFMPRPADPALHGGRVLSIANDLVGGGKYQVFALNKGLADGVQPGQVLAIFHPGRTIEDQVKYASNDVRRVLNPGKSRVKLPDEYTGDAMVFRTFQNVSYALVMKASRPIEVGDKLTSPKNLR